MTIDIVQLEAHRRRIAYEVLLMGVMDLVGKSEKRSQKAYEWLASGGWVGGEFTVEVLGIRPSALKDAADLLLDRRERLLGQPKFSAERLITALMEAEDDGKDDEVS